MVAAGQKRTPSRLDDKDSSPFSQLGETTTRPFLPFEMAPDREKDDPVSYTRHSRHSASPSPEPYKERRRSRERRRRSSSRSSNSNGHERRIYRVRDSHRHDRSKPSRSKSPRRSFHRQRRQSQSGANYEEDHEVNDGGISRPKHHIRSRPDDEDSSYKRSRNSKDNPVRKPRALPSQEAAFTVNSTAVIKAPSDAEKEKQKQKPNFSATGRLAAESNTVKSSDGQAIVLKYHEPAEARKPPSSQPWRMYVFKGSEIIDTVELSERTCWLFGRENAVVDCLIEHPSCSKQHAVVQFRYVEKRNEFGDKSGRVKPYLIDLESANGTMMNGEEVPAGRYLELRNEDVVKFGHSTREYLVQLPT